LNSYKANKFKNTGILMLKFEAHMFYVGMSIALLGLVWHS